MTNLHLSKIEASDFINPVYVDIAVKINKGKLAEKGPNIDKMYSLMIQTLDNALSDEFWMKKELGAFRDVVDAFPDAYNMIEECFFEEYSNTNRNREVCTIINDYVRDYLIGMTKIVSAHPDAEDEEAIMNEAKQLAMDLKHELYLGLGIRFDEWQ
ncbi:MAG: hypothetical protein SA339_02005 [Methanomassiliicoccus sp.]|nr:hypothetical protein [Methanomassiliicoccus sp.]